MGKRKWYTPGWYIVSNGKRIRGPISTVIGCEMIAQRLKLDNPDIDLTIEYEKEKDYAL